MDLFLWGLKTNSFFDLWTLIHILNGIILSAILIKISMSKNKHNLLISIIIAAYLWEIFEYFAEIGLFGLSMKSWFYGVEFLPNRLLIDPLSILLGSLIYRKFPKSLIPAVTIVSIWMLTHIFIFNSSVYLQQLIW